MNKTILKILLCILILLIGIGAVNAIEHNSTDDLISIEQNDGKSLVDDNKDLISISENNSGVLSTENNTNVISISNNNLTSSSLANGSQSIQSETQYKTFYLGKMVFLKKYKKMFLKGYKTPSKKNKKAWKKHITYQKAYKKQMKKLKKISFKVILKQIRGNWHERGDIYHKVKYSGKYMYIKFYQNCYRTYNYDPIFNRGWYE